MEVYSFKPKEKPKERNNESLSKIIFSSLEDFVLFILETVSFILKVLLFGMICLLLLIVVEVIFPTLPKEANILIVVVIAKHVVNKNRMFPFFRGE